MSVDNDFVDEFEDGSVRWDPAGIRRFALSKWSSTISFDYENEEVSLRVFWDGELTNVSSSKTVNLNQTKTKIRVIEIPDINVFETSADNWPTPSETGVYEIDVSGANFSGPNVYVIEVLFHGEYTNPEVNNKTSVGSGNTVSYGSQLIDIPFITTEQNLAVDASSNFLPTAPEQNESEGVTNLFHFDSFPWRTDPEISPFVAERISAMLGMWPMKVEFERTDGLIDKVIYTVTDIALEGFPNTITNTAQVIDRNANDEPIRIDYTIRKDNGENITIRKDISWSNGAILEIDTYEP